MASKSNIKTKTIAEQHVLEFSAVFWKYIEYFSSLFKYIVSVGGTRSTKTYSAIQLLHLKAKAQANLTILMVGLTIPVVKKNLIETFREILGPEYDPENYNVTDRLYRYPNGSKIYFDSGENEEKFVGVATDYALLDEANLYPEGEGIVSQIGMRNRIGIIITFNPSRPLPWLEELEENPKTMSMHSTYKDNEFLTQSQIDDLEYRGSKNKRFKAVYLDGVYQANSDQAIFNDWTISNEWPSVFEWSAYGADFGMKDPNTLVEVRFANKELYVRGRLYRPGMTTNALHTHFKDITGSRLIVADSSEPRLILELGTKGLNIIPVKKYPGSVIDGIRSLQNVRINVYYDDPALIREFEDYQFIKRQGVILDKPEDKNNHYIDALRYAVKDKLITGRGKYSFGIR